MIKRTFTLDEQHAAFLATQDNASLAVRAALDVYIAGQRPTTLADVRADIATLRAELRGMTFAAPAGSVVEDDELSNALENLGL